jgi:hypothetical protein
VQDIAEGLRDALANIVDTVYLYPADNPEPTCIICLPDDVPYDKTFGSSVGRQTWRLRLLVGRIEQESSWSTIYNYCTPSDALSVKGAVEADGTLGGACDSARVERASNFSQYEYAENAVYLGCEFTVDIVG